MCNGSLKSEYHNVNELLNNKINEYTNNQTGELLDWDKVEELKDNALLKIRPDLWCEWDFEKNNELGYDIWKMTKGIKKKARWVCDKGHEWDAILRDRVRGSKCPYCANRKVMIGFNDLRTTHPEVSKLLLDERDGLTYTYGSRVNLDWVCEYCGRTIFNKSPNDVVSRGLSCKCTPRTRLGERVVSLILNSLGEDYYCEKTFTWSNRKRYDFYLPEHSAIIEVHGGQHYLENGFNFSGGMTLKEEQENDGFKEQLAKDNGIENYIVIDCRKSDLEWIKKNILNSYLTKILAMSEVNWTDIGKSACKPIALNVIELKKQGKSIKSIQEEFKISRTTIYNYLRRFKNHGA